MAFPTLFSYVRISKVSKLHDVGPHDIAQKFLNLWPPPLALLVEGGATPR